MSAFSGKDFRRFVGEASHRELQARIADLQTFLDATASMTYRQHDVEARRALATIRAEMSARHEVGDVR